jgi:hypothetical protein
MTTGVLMLDIEGTALNAVETEQIKSPQPQL